MEVQELTGYYTYRGFLNLPLPVNDFNSIKNGEAELFMMVQLDGTISGTLSFPAEGGAPEKLFVDLTGKVKNWSPPMALEFKGKGRPNTPISDYHYEYFCSATPMWENGIDQRLALTGTVLQAHDQGTRDPSARAGATASFISVKRDFVEPKDIAGVALIPNALAMIASRSHRLKHTVWHTARGEWNDLEQESKMKIRDLGWGIDRPPFTKEGGLDLENGAGEDFLFMHRKMIAMVRKEYDTQKVPPIESWTTLPRPNSQQFSYLEQDDPANPGKKIFRFDALNSGFMVPPAQPNNSDTLRFIKSPDYFRLVMAQLERLFTRQSYLSALSLGALGNLLEFTIHNQMHNRWSSVSRDPKTGKPAIRGDFDFDEKWDDPKYDFLGEFHSSHVNPVFWKLHGWVDDRMEDWFDAHEAAQPGEIERYEYQGIPWFKPGKWAQVEKPFYWPESHHHEHHGDDNDEIVVMLKVMEIIRTDPTDLRARTRVLGLHPDVGITSFMRAIHRVQSSS